MRMRMMPSDFHDGLVFFSPVSRFPSEPRIVFTLFLLNFGVVNHLVAIMVDCVSNISGEAQEMQEKLLSKAHDALIKALEADLRAGIGMDGKLSIWELEFWVKGVGVKEGERMVANSQMTTEDTSRKMIICGNCNWG